MNVQREIKKINEREQKIGIDVSTSASWHGDYKDSPYVFAGGLSFKLNEGDLMVVFSQWGTINHINLIRDKKTGKSKGFAFIGYEDQRSTTLVVDNMNGVTLDGRLITVDHKKDYKPPKDSDEESSSYDRKDDKKKRKKKDSDKKEKKKKKEDEDVPTDLAKLEELQKKERKRQRKESKTDVLRREELRKALG